jgi:hypothetical protein
VPDFAAKRTELVYAERRAEPMRTTHDAPDCVIPAPQSSIDRYIAAHRGRLIGPR